MEIGRVLAKTVKRDRAAATDADPQRVRARNLRAAMEELGPTFAKLGQILSTRPDLIPQEFVDELSLLQDKVTPLTEAEVVSVMEEELRVPWEDVFDSIEQEPLAAGTMGQVHRATLAGGERVVVKVQRPTAQDEILRDLGLLELFAQKVSTRPVFRQLIDMPAAIEHLSVSLRRELDFSLEHEHVERMRVILEPFPRLDVARVYEQLSTKRLLVLEEIQGVPLRQAEPDEQERKEAARQLLEAYYQQILTHGFFHADPHPGNLMWADGKIYLLDLGMVGELGSQTRELLLLLLMAFWQGDTSFLAEIVLLLGGAGPPRELNLQQFEEELAELLLRYRDASLQEIQLGPILQGLTQIAARHDVRLPASLALAGKAFAQMQLAAARLDPELDPFAVIGEFLRRGFLARFRAVADPKRVMYEAEKLKTRFERLTDAFERVIGSRPGAKLQVEFRGMEPLERTISGAGRRLALGMSGGSAVIAAGVTAASDQVGEWVPISFAGVGGFFALLLLADLRRR